MKALHTFDEVFDTQTVFRLLLEAMSNPARTVSLVAEKEKLFGSAPTFLAVAMTLLDNEVTFAVCGDEVLQKDIQLLTLSRAAGLAEADYVFLADPSTLTEVIPQVKYGTLIDPHQNASLLIRDNGEKTESLVLYGPGIAGDTVLLCSETARQALELRDQQAYEYPTGVDLFFVGDDGTVTCIPRLVQRREMAWHM